MIPDHTEAEPCRHPYVSRSWIGFSGYCHCWECDKIVKDDRYDEDKEKLCLCGLPYNESIDSWGVCTTCFGP